MSAPLRLGISACLLGEKVRYDGNHKRDGYIVETLGRYCDFQSFCPETAIGMGVPRPPIRLVGDPASPRAVGVQDPGLDVTTRLTRYGRDTARVIGHLDGFILKANSPSCGMQRVRLYGDGSAGRRGVGLFARELMRANPLLPLEEEGRLNDPLLRDGFIERLFTYRRWRRLLAERLTAHRLMQFHSAHKYALMAHGNAHYKALGQLAAEAGDRPMTELKQAYGSRLMEALHHPAAPGRHANVLQHLMGYLKKSIDADDKAELNNVIDAYRRGRVPLAVPLTLLRHHFRRHPDPYITRQTYLNPEPAELILRRLV